MMKKTLVLSVCLFICLSGCSNSKQKTLLSEHDFEDTKKTNDSVDVVDEKKEEIVMQKYIVYDYFFTNDLRWNMSYDEAEDSINFAPSSGGLKPGNNYTGAMGSLEFSGHRSYGKEVEFNDDYVFVFPESALKAYWVEFDKKTIDGDKDYLGLYNDIKQKVSSLYGEPTVENHNWTEETYKANESDWPTGFKYGYLTIETQWTSSADKEIVVRWDYNGGMCIIICEKGYIPYL